MEGGGQGEEGAKWVTHYSSDHQILLVGDGDFSFSLSLAHSFGSASNIVASSLDSYDAVTKKYKDARSNLNKLQMLGACLLHEVDATKMRHHPDLKIRRFDRVIFNFPHAGFHGKEVNSCMIKKHKDLVLGFFENASHMLRAYGEIHVSHKTGGPYDRWNIEKLAVESFLKLIEHTNFKKDDYLGYNNKRGDGCRCDEPFALGKCSTFKFVLDPRAIFGNGKCDRRNQTSLKQPTNLAFQEMHTPPSISSCLNMVARRITAPRAIYSTHSMFQGSQRLFQPLQPTEPLISFQPGPTPTNVRYSQTDRVRARDILPRPLGARNEGYQASSGSSNYLPEPRGVTSESAGRYSYDRDKPEFESYISEANWRALNGGNDVHREIPRMSAFEEERRRMFARFNFTRRERHL